LTWNNVAYYESLMSGIRASIEEARFAEHAALITEGWKRGDLPAL
ncbi:MAG TPA: tRNA guanosine(34) transglycosylase Tgt, partial [Rhizobiaceae bacterium]|nr:tRNA guanosine(34) transglycosylase Tgt [Rhizobiaceae bacterium]